MTQTVGARRLYRRSEWGLAAFSVPALAWYLVFTIGPLLAVFVLSLLRWGGFLEKPEWAGLTNYSRVFGDALFHDATLNTALQLVIVLPIMMPASFMLGYYLNLRPRFHRALRVILFTPALLSVAAMGTAFYAILQPAGLVNTTLRKVGLASLATPWLANPDTALAAVMAVTLWSGIGFTAVLFSARLGAVGRDVYEAAELDGCGHWARMWRIAFPITIDYFGVLVMLQFLWTLFGSAGIILLLTKGGPGNATFTLSFLAYEKAFVQSQVGYSQVVGVILFIFGIVGLFGIRRLFRQQY